MVVRVKKTKTVASDARYTTSQIANVVGISLGAAHTVLELNMKMSKICARWISHELTHEQKKDVFAMRKNFA